MRLFRRSIKNNSFNHHMEKFKTSAVRMEKKVQETEKRIDRVEVTLNGEKNLFVLIPCRAKDQTNLEKKHDICNSETSDS